MKISYSIATELDCLGISYVIAHSWNETYKGLVSQKCLDLKIENIESKSEKIKDYLKTSGNSYYVAKDENNVIGVVSFSKQENELYKDYGELCSIYLLKQYHGYNIGKTLLKIAVEGLKKMGYNKMKLECMSGNNTINFYKKYGGVVSSQIDYNIKNNGMVKVDIVLFENLDNVLSLLNL